MNKKDVRNLFAQSLMKLLEKQSIQTISIRQLSQQSGLSSRSFYNHFADKYDLMYFLYHHLDEKAWFDGKALMSYEEASSRSTRELLNNWEIFKNMFMYAGQNNIRKYVLTKSISNLNRLLLWNGHSELLSNQELQEQISLVAHATLGLIDNSLNSPMSHNFTAETILKCFKPDVREIIRTKPHPDNPMNIEVYDPENFSWPAKLYLS